MKKFLPLGENVLVQIAKLEKSTKSGIVLPDNASEEKSQEGIIKAVGDSEKISKLLKKDARVIFEKYAGNEIEMEKEKYLLIKAENILAVVE